MQARLTTKPTQEVIAAIQALDLESVKLRAMDPELGEGWTREYADCIEVAYKNYLMMLAKYPEQAEDILLSRDVDEFWHTHILQTLKYTEDCERVFGAFLHHSPHVGERSVEDLAKRAVLAEKTRLLYEAEFRNAHEAEAAWAGKSIAGEKAAGSTAATKADSAAWSTAAVKAERGAWSTAAIKPDSAAWSTAAVKVEQAAWSTAAIKAQNAAWSTAAIKGENGAWSTAAIKAEKAAWSTAAIKAQNAAWSTAAIKAENAAWSTAAIKAEKAAWSTATIKVENTASSTDTVHAAPVGL